MTLFQIANIRDMQTAIYTLASKQRRSLTQAEVCNLAALDRRIEETCEAARAQRVRVFEFWRVPRLAHES